MGEVGMVRAWRDARTRPAHSTMCISERLAVPNRVRWYRTLNSTGRQFRVKPERELHGATRQDPFELGLKLDGFNAERFVQQLRELEPRASKVTYACYLTDEWEVVWQPSSDFRSIVPTRTWHSEAR